MTEITEQAVQTETPVAYFRGEPLKMKLTLWALIRLEEDYGLNLKDMQSEDGSADFSFSQICQLVTVGVLYKYPDTTFQEVAESFVIGDMEALGAELERAVSASSAVGKPAQSLGLA